MLHQISWTSFLTGFAVLSALWYVALLLTVYRKDFSRRFVLGGKQNTPAEAVHPADLKNMDDLEKELMGESRMPEGLSTISMSTLAFAPGAIARTDDDAKADQLGLIPDVIQELKDIFAVLAREDGTKKDFLSLIGIIQEKYGHIGSHPNIQQLNEYIRQHAPFALTNEEMGNLWG